MFSESGNERTVLSLVMKVETGKDVRGRWTPDCPTEGAWTGGKQGIHRQTEACTELREVLGRYIWQQS